jgi:hypothetical protein
MIFDWVLRDASISNKAHALATKQFSEGEVPGIVVQLCLASKEMMLWLGLRAKRVRFMEQDSTYSGP